MGKTNMWFHTFMVWFIGFMFKVCYTRVGFHQCGYGWSVNYLNYPCVSTINAHPRTLWLERLWYKITDSYYEDHVKYGNGYAIRNTWKGNA